MLYLNTLRITHVTGTNGSGSVFTMGDNTGDKSGCDSVSARAGGTVADADCRWLEAVEGDAGKTNDILFCGDASGVCKRDVIFFGGDMQVYT